MNNTNIHTLIAEIKQQLAHRYADPVLCTQYAWWLLEALTQKTHTELMMHDVALSTAQREQLNSWITQLVVHAQPLQYILGSVPFGELEILVQAPTLIPRPETEEWCLNLIRQLQEKNTIPHKVLDLCTGSGCIALLIAHACTDAQITGIDIEPAAIALAQKNAQHNNITNATFYLSDLYSNLPAEQKYDLIVTNPPYIAHEEWLTLDESVKAWEDQKALVANHQGAAIIEHIIEHAPRYLQPGGLLVIEIGYNQGELVAQLLRAAQFENVIICKDMAGKDRVVMGSNGNVASTFNLQ